MTRGELREELERLRQEFRQEFATKRDLEIWAGALQARIQSGEQRLTERIDRTEQRLSAELARHAGAIQESMSALFAAHDEQYADLPGRVSRLEAAVFPAKRR